MLNKVIIVMKNAKRCLSVLMSVVLMITTISSFNLSVASAAATKGTCGDKAEWSYDAATKTLTISGTGATTDYRATLKTAPWAEYKPNITTIIVEEGITALGNYNFYNCTALKNVSLPSTLASIHGSGTMTTSYGCFQGCTALEEITLPSNLTEIQNCAFKGCSSLKKIVFPDSLTKLAYGAFCECTNLATVTFGAGLKETGSNAFYKSGVKYINWNENLTTVSEYSFYNTGVTTVNIPETITSIGLRSFADCTFLREITINNANCTFSGDFVNGSNQTITVCGHKASTAESFATQYNYAFKSIDACEHLNTHTEITVAATCTEKGLDSVICNDCNAVVSQTETRALGHDWQIQDTLDNTGVDGHIYTYSKCSRCPETKDEVEHQRATAADSLTRYIWIEGFYTSTKNVATCTSPGYERYTCTVENCTRTETRIITGGSHTVTEWTIVSEPTCTQEGSRTGVCSECNETVTEKIPATGHDLSNLIEEADSTAEDGHIHRVYLCPNCNEQVTQHEHVEWKEGFYTTTVLTAPHCVISGTGRDVCDICDESRVVTIPSNGKHEWVETSRTEPKCSSDGTIFYACANCTMTKTETIKSPGHDYVLEEAGSKAPTCNDPGYNVYVCRVCNASKQENVPKTGHTVDENNYIVIAQPNCEDAGTAVSVCTVCSTEFEITLDALGHDYQNVETDLTAENNPGHVLVTPTCSVCGNTAPGKKEHREWLEGYYTTEEESPTCLTDGKIVDSCTLCPEKRENPIPKLGHMYVYSGTSTSDRLKYQCSVCHLPTILSAADLSLKWNMKYVNKAPERTAVNDSSYLDLNNDGIINAKDYALLNRLKKAEEQAGGNTGEKTDTPNPAEPVDPSQPTENNGENAAN